MRDRRRLRTCGFIQVLRLLEDVGLPELVIQLASLAVPEAVGDVTSQVSGFLSSTVSQPDQVSRDFVLLSSGCSVDTNIQAPPGPGAQR